MDRPTQHETDDQGEALLYTVVAGLKWTANRIGKDYGRDFEVEIFHDGKTTGMLFIVQLKSTVSPRYSKDGSYLSVDLKARNARYLCGELRLPTTLDLRTVGRRGGVVIAKHGFVRALPALKPTRNTRGRCKHTALRLRGHG